jgi:TPR repeat protein
MFCIECGTQHIKASKLCRVCGTEVPGAATISAKDPQKEARPKGQPGPKRQFQPRTEAFSTPAARLSRDGDSHDAFWRGLHSFEFGDFDRAEEHWKEAAERHHHPEATYRLWRLFRQLGREEESSHWEERFFGLDDLNIYDSIQFAVDSYDGGDLSAIDDYIRHFEDVEVLMLAIALRLGHEPAWERIRAWWLSEGWYPISRGRLGPISDEDHDLLAELAEHLERFEQEAKTGDTKAMCLLGSLVFHEDRNRAMDWYLKALRGGSAAAVEALLGVFDYEDELEELVAMLRLGVVWGNVAAAEALARLDD